MADQKHSEVLGALPRSRPHRRSAKRPPRANGSAVETTTATETAPPKKAKRATTASPKATSPKAASPKATSPKATRRTATPSRPTSKRSEPNAARRAKPRTDPLRQPPQPRGIPSQPRSPVPPSSHKPQVLGTVVQATAELTEIGLSLSARALRRVVGRLPRP